MTEKIKKMPPGEVAGRREWVGEGQTVSDW